MDVNRRFTFEPGTRLYSISRGAYSKVNPISSGVTWNYKDLEELYYTTPEEAILSAFHSAPGNWTGAALEDNPFTLRVYTVEKTMDVIDDAPPSIQRVVEKGFRHEVTFGLDLRRKCPPDNRPGFYVQVPIVLRSGYNSAGDIDGVVGKAGRLTAFIFCLANSLLLLRELDVDTTLIENIIELARQRRKAGLTLDFAELSQMVRDTLAERGEDYLEIIPIDVAPMSNPALNMLVPATGYQGSLAVGFSSGYQGSLGPSTSSPILDLSSPETVREDPFENLPDDLIRYMAQGYTLEAIGRFCRAFSRFNRAVCDNEAFWTNKILAENKNEDLSKKPENMSYREYYMRRFTTPGWESAIRKIHSGLTTYGLIHFLIKATSYGGRGILRDTLSRLLGFGVNPMVVKVHFDARNGFAPKDETGQRLVMIRPQLYDAVAMLVSQMGLDRPQDGTVKVIDRPYQMIDPASLPYLLKGTGFSMGERWVPRGMGSWLPSENVRPEAFRRAFMKVWRLTQRDQEPIPQVRERM